VSYIADIATQLQHGTTRIVTTMKRARTTGRRGGFASMRAPLGTDAFNVEFVLQAAACIDWPALDPWMDAVDGKLGTALPTSVYKLHLLAFWFKLDDETLEHACMRRAEFRRFISAPLHGPIVDVQLYREYAPQLRRAPAAFNKLVAAVELQLIDRGFFPPTEVLGRLDLSDPSGRVTVPTLVLPHAPRPVARDFPEDAAPEPGVERMASSKLLVSDRQAVLIWPWGETTPINRRIHVGRDTDYSEFAKHLSADRKVSRKHAVIEPVEDGVRLHDLGSVNGTYIDGEPMHHSDTRLLTKDAVIKFGTELTVMLVFADGAQADGLEP